MTDFDLMYLTPENGAPRTGWYLVNDDEYTGPYPTKLDAEKAVVKMTEMTLASTSNNPNLIVRSDKETKTIWIEDKRHPVCDWKNKVATDNTRLGYADWVEQQEDE